MFYKQPLALELSSFLLSEGEFSVQILLKKKCMK